MHGQRVRGIDGHLACLPLAFADASRSVLQRPLARFTLRCQRCRCCRFMCCTADHHLSCPADQRIVISILVQRIIISSPLDSGSSSASLLYSSAMMDQQNTATASHRRTRHHTRHPTTSRCRRCTSLPTTPPLTEHHRWQTQHTHHLLYRKSLVSSAGSTHLAGNTHTHTLSGESCLVSREHIRTHTHTHAHTRKVTTSSLTVRQLDSRGNPWTCPAPARSPRMASSPPTESPRHSHLPAPPAA